MMPKSVVSGLLVLLSLAIGVAVVGGTALGARALGSQIDLSEAQNVLLIQVLMVAAPFIALALAGVRSRRAWATGLILTGALWSAVLVSVYQSHGGGANIGMGLLILASPFIIGIAAFWAGSKAP